ncbi:MAG: hypothetical protein ACI8W8_001237 [Rhodothermales bacterium]
MRPNPAKHTGGEAQGKWAARTRALALFCNLRAISESAGGRSENGRYLRRMRHHNTQSCSDELFAFLNTGNARRFANVLGTPRYPWHAWFCDILRHENRAIAPGDDLRQAIASHNDVHTRFAEHFRQAASECSFLGAESATWADWDFLQGDVWGSFYLPTWLIVGSRNGDAHGLCLQVAIHVSFSESADDELHADLLPWESALTQAAEHVRRAWPGAPPSFRIATRGTLPPLGQATGSSFSGALGAAARLFANSADRHLLARWREIVLSADLHEDGLHFNSVGGYAGKLAALADMEHDAPRPNRFVVPAGDPLPRRCHGQEIAVIPLATLDELFAYLRHKRVPENAQQPGREHHNAIAQDTLVGIENTHPKNSLLTVPALRRQSLMARVEQHISSPGPALVIEGEMGMGKSILLAEIARAYCQQTLAAGSEGEEADVPLFFTAADFAQPVADLVDARIHAATGWHGDTLWRLRKEEPFRYLILFVDGLNEVDFHDDLAQELMAFRDCLPGEGDWLRVVLTSRPDAAASCRHHPEFYTDVLGVEPFSDDELRLCFERMRRSGEGVSFAIDRIPAVTRELIKTPLLHTLFQKTFHGRKASELPVDPPLSIPLQFCREFIRRLRRDHPRLFAHLGVWTGMLSKRQTVCLTRHECGELIGRQGLGAYDFLLGNGLLVPAEAAHEARTAAVQLLHPGITSYLLYFFEFAQHHPLNPTDVHAALARPQLRDTAALVLQSWIEHESWDKLLAFLRLSVDDFGHHLATLTPYVGRLDDRFWRELAALYADSATPIRLELELWERLLLRGKGARAGRSSFWEKVLTTSTEPEDRLRCLSLLCRSGLLPDKSFSLVYCEELASLLRRSELTPAARIVGRYVLADMAANRPRATTPWRAEKLLDQVRLDLSDLTLEDWRSVLPPRLHERGFLLAYDAYVKGYVEETQGKVSRRLQLPTATITRHYAQALRCFTESCRLPALRAVAETGMSRVWHNQITFCHYRGDFAAAMNAARLRFSQGLRSHNLDDCAASLANFSSLLMTLGLYEEAQTVCVTAARLNAAAHNVLGVLLSQVHGIQVALLAGDHAAAEAWDAQIVTLLREDGPWENRQEMRDDAAGECAYWGTITWLRALVNGLDLEQIEARDWRGVLGDATVSTVVADDDAVTELVLRSPQRGDSFLAPMRRFAAVLARAREGVDDSADMICELRNGYQVLAHRLARLAESTAVDLPWLAVLAAERPLPSATPLHHYQQQVRELLHQIDLAWPE